MQVNQNKKSGASQINLTAYETEELSKLLKWYLSNTTDSKKTTEFFRKLSDEISIIFEEEKCCGTCFFMIKHSIEYCSYHDKEISEKDKACIKYQ